MSALPGTTGRRRIYLMRHGHVDYFSNRVATKGAHEAALTKLGIAQATASGQALSHVAFDLTISSGYPRTRDTLDLVMAQNEQAKPEHEIEPDMVEVRTGKMPGVTSRRDMATAMTFAYDAAGGPGASLFPEGEVFADALARGERAFLKLLARPDWHTALLVAHEGINRLMLGWMTGNNLAAVQTFEQDLACINILDFDLVPAESGDGVTIARRIIKAVNLTPYNYVKHGMNLTSLEFIFEHYEERPDEE
jgi:probable phosphoglycerate mutase